MAFYGVLYKHDSNENFEPFVKSLNLPDDKAAAYASYKPSQKIEQNGDEYVITTIAPQGPILMKFKSGVEFEEQISPDISGKNTITVDGNKVTQVQKFADGKTITYVREYTPEKLVVTITASFWDGTAKRIYLA
ncbi:unnamed protein product [Leptosia nina]|uniref:Uncharacterized protein n=1 Tax=Leptosia nina TaxID=320188 RepID=A0AAV1IZH2_9NEOP